MSTEDLDLPDVAENQPDVTFTSMSPPSPPPPPPPPTARGANNEKPQSQNSTQGKSGSVVEILVNKGNTRAPWSDHYIKCLVDGVVKAQCKYCFAYLLAEGKSGTNGIRNHISACKLYPPNIELRTLTQINLPPASSVNETATNDCREIGSSAQVGYCKFDQQLCRKALARYIIMDELPFRHVENEGFKHWVSVSCPSFKIPSCTIVTRDCFKLYLDKKLKLKAYFKNSGQRVSLTTDTWTLIQRINYMVLTAYFIDKNWKSNKKILNFVPIICHKGDSIGMAIGRCLVEWDIKKVFTITVDNASSNDTSIAFLKAQSTFMRNSICDNKYLHIRCVAHVLNLVVTDGLKELSKEVARVDHALGGCVVLLLGVKKFQECIDFEKIERKNSLAIDVPTRWNSTYTMLNVACFYERAFNRLGSRIPSFKMDIIEENGWPSEEDWSIVRRYVQFLEVFFEATCRISGSFYVTSDSFFEEFVDIKVFVSELEQDDDEGMQVMARKMRAKYEKYWGDVDKMNKLLYLSICLSPREKMEFISYGFSVIYGHDVEKLERIVKGVRDVLYELFSFYSKNHESQTQNQSASSSSASSQSGISFMSGTSRESHGSRQRRRVGDRFQEHLARVQGREEQNELDSYLAEPCVKKSKKEFNLLGWWKSNAPRFPILSQMAKDILVIPISTVALESAFSTGGRVFDPFRSSLTPRMVQVLICMQDWIRTRRGWFNLEEKLEELKQIEDEFSSADSSIIDEGNAIDENDS